MIVRYAELVQQLSITVGTKRSILDYLLVEFLAPILLNSVGLAIFIQFYNPVVQAKYDNIHDKD
jgi:hypothetical protein